MPSPDQLRILTLIFFFLFLLLGVGRPVYAVSAYMILVYCKMSEYYPFLTQIRAEALFAALILLRVAATGNLQKNLRFTSSKINKYLYYLVLCVALSFIFAWDHQYSWDMAVYHFIKTLILYILIVGVISDIKDVKVFVWTFLLMFLYLAYEPMYGFMTGSSGQQQMYGTNYIGEVGLLSGHVALANNMNQMLPLAWFIFLGNKNKWSRIASGACFFVYLLALVGSGSRGGVVGMVVWGGLIVWFSKERGKMIALMLPILVILLITQGSSIIHTAGRIDSRSTEGRLTGLSHGVGMLTRGNLVGVGPGCYLFARGKYFSYRMESHNIYGQIIGDLGLPGMLTTFLLMYSILKKISEIKRRLVGAGVQEIFLVNLMTGVQVSLITRLFISMASHGLYFFYWYVMAAIVVTTSRLVDEQIMANTEEEEKKPRFFGGRSAIPEK